MLEMHMYDVWILRVFIPFDIIPSGEMDSIHL